MSVVRGMRNQEPGLPAGCGHGPDVASGDKGDLAAVRRDRRFRECRPRGDGSACLGGENCGGSNEQAGGDNRGTEWAMRGHQDVSGKKGSIERCHTPAMLTHGVASRCVRLVAIRGLGEIRPGEDLVGMLTRAIRAGDYPIAAGDVFVITQKIVSKAEGALVALDSVTPSARAGEWARAWNKDPRVIELVLRESVRLVRMERGVIISETRHGLICANAGVDTSNVEPGWAALLPPDPDASAQRLCRGLRDAFGVRIGVVISDTFGRPWREGQINVAIGVAGLVPISDYRGGSDTYGQRLVSSAIAVADELAAAAELVMGKTDGVPAAIVGGTDLGVAESGQGSARALLRRPEEDMFR
jgi:coenzyme F420-0:L-glutamate ligase / coenzyme F420-1:gamma-L-glutamate ligase